MVNWFEKRRHHRLTAALQLAVRRPEAPGRPKQEYKGLTENISMGGVYFILPRAPEEMFQVNDIVEVSIKIPRQNYEFAWASTLKARSQVVRLEPIADRPGAIGVALKFLEDLQFANS